MASCKVLTIGWGATGVLYSFICHSGGAELTGMARSNYQAAQRGVELDSGKFGNFPAWKPHRIISGPKDVEGEIFDYVLFTAKCLPDVTPTQDVIRPYLSQPPPGTSGPTIVLIQNGIGIEDVVYETLVVREKLASALISCVAWLGTSMNDAGDRVEHGALERLQMGLFPTPSSPSESTRSDEQASLQRFHDLYRAGGGGAELVPDIQAERWKKVLWNAGWGGLSTLARVPTASLLLPDVLQWTIPVVRRTMLEVVSVGRACGMSEEAFPSAAIDAAINVTLQNAEPPALYSGANKPPPPGAPKTISDSFKPSILMDLEAARPMELMPIIGSLVARARLHAIETPRLDFILAALGPAQSIARRNRGVQESQYDGLPVFTAGFPV